nr:elastin-like [Aegilops tauschii subsp. strangulata]
MVIPSGLPLLPSLPPSRGAPASAREGGGNPSVAPVPPSSSLPPLTAGGGGALSFPLSVRQARASGSGGGAAFARGAAAAAGGGVKGLQQRWCAARSGGGVRPDLGPAGEGHGRRVLRASAPTVASAGGGGGAAAVAGGPAGRDPVIPPAGRRRQGQMGSPMSILGVRRLYLGYPLPVVGSASVPLRGVASATEGGTGVCPVRRLAEGMGGADMLGTPSLTQGCAGTDASASPPPPFPDRVLAVAAPAMFKAGCMLRFVGRWGSFGAKLISLDGLGGVWMLGGGPGGRRRGVRGRNLRLWCGRAAMVSRGTWLRVVGEAGVCRRGASTRVHHLHSPFLTVGGDVRGCRILLEGSVTVLPPLASLRVKT